VWGTRKKFEDTHAGQNIIRRNTSVDLFCETVVGDHDLSEGGIKRVNRFVLKEKGDTRIMDMKFQFKNVRKDNEKLKGVWVQLKKETGPALRIQHIHLDKFYGKSHHIYGLDLGKRKAQKNCGAVARKILGNFSVVEKEGV